MRRGKGGKVRTGICENSTLTSHNSLQLTSAWCLLGSSPDHMKSLVCGKNAKEEPAGCVVSAWVRTEPPFRARAPPSLAASLPTGRRVKLQHVPTQALQQLPLSMHGNGMQQMTKSA